MIHLPLELTSIRTARDFVREVLAEHSLQMWEPVLVASELSANVVRHAGTAYMVRVSVERDEVRVEVEDRAADQEVSLDLHRDTGGYGLQVIDRLATEWGVDRYDEAKVVWASFARS